MPSLKTRLSYQAAILNKAQGALNEAANSVSVAADTLTNLSSGDLDMDAVKVGGVRFVNVAGELVPDA